MGSVSMSCECPHCKAEATEESYYKTGEVYIMCSFCGYYLSIEIDREKLEKDGKKWNEITEEYWKRKEIIPVASYYEQFKNFGRCSTIEEGTVEELIANIKADRDVIMKHPEYQNMFLNWYDGKDHYQYDLNKDAIEKIMFEPVLDSAGFDSNGNNHYKPNEL